MRACLLFTLGVVLLTTALAADDSFDAWLRADFPVADGFVLYGGTDARAVAAGRVTLVQAGEGTSSGSVTIEHLFYENEQRREMRSTYLIKGDARVRRGDVVEQGDPIGRLQRRAVVRLDPSPESMPTFLRTHVRLPVPQKERALVLVDQDRRQMRLYLEGEPVGTYEVGFGQAPERKRRQGDLATPIGMYFVIAKSRGPFPGRWGGFYGGHWIKLNYPNASDAAWGRANALLTAGQERRIADAWLTRKLTWQGSALGGGIGFHGWIEDWDLNGPRRLSWGCVVMRNADIAAAFDRIPIGAMVVLF